MRTADSTFDMLIKLCEARVVALRLCDPSLAKRTATLVLACVGALTGDSIEKNTVLEVSVAWRVWDIAV